MKKVWGLIGALGCAFGALTCGRLETSDGAAGAAAQPAVVALSSDISGVNPLLAGGSVTRDILDEIFLTLLEENPDFAEGPPTFGPRLARDWSWSEDGRTLTLELREDAVWSDGQPITAADVVWSFEAQTHPAVAWRGADTRERIDGWRALADHTVEVRFTSPYPSRLGDLNRGPILPRHLWSEVPFSEWRRSGDWFRRHLVASGPFVIERWRPDAEIVLARNPRYFRADRPRLDRVVFRVIPDAANRLELLLAGRVDFVSGLRPTAARRVETSQAARVTGFWNRQYLYFGWNGCQPPFDDHLVRRALTLAIDRETLIEAVYGEHGRLAVSPILSHAWPFDRELEPWPWDPDRAVELLATRGFADTDGDGLLDRDGEPLTVELMTNSENRMRMDLATLAHSQLQAIGIDARLDFVEFAVFVDRLREPRYDGALSSWNVDTAFDLKSVFHSHSIEGGQNFGCYRNPEVDRLIDSARGRLDLDELAADLVAIQRLVHADQPYTFLAEVRRLNGLSLRLRGAEPSPLDNLGALDEWSFAAAEVASFEPPPG